MRLLQTSTLQLHEFQESKVPPYVILSHTWEHDEVLYADITSGLARRRKGYHKVVNSCKRAQWDDYEWIWIDACCIDKSSSSELSEAINSMFRWYQDAQICYAYITDVDSTSSTKDVVEQLKDSRWLTRGWTLQELIGEQFLKSHQAKGTMSE
jgi:hypothetical protein